MKRNLQSILIITVALLTLCLSGCAKDSRKEVEGAVYQSLNQTPDAFAALLEAGIEKTNADNDFLLQFPEELKEPYMEFLNTAFSCIDFEVSSIDEKEEGVYSARLSFAPLDIQETVKENDITFVESMQETDLTKAMTALLDSESDILKTKPVYTLNSAFDLSITQKDDSFAVSDEDIQKLIKASLENYMAPYENICSVLDTRDFLQAYLDAIFKGELSRIMEHTGQTEAQTAKLYDADGTFAPPEDLSEQYRERCTAAYKNIVKQCKYSIGIPNRNEGIYSYTVDVTFSPNNSLINSWDEFINGTYSDLDTASAAYVENLERYAAAPSYGEEQTSTIELNLNSFLTQDETSDLYRLVAAICPIPE